MTFLSDQARVNGHLSVLPSQDGNLDALQRENDQLRAALTSRPEIEQAKGALMALHKCDADAAFAMLVRESQTKNVKLRVVAHNLVTRLGT
jgi:AmiR/NasT family two-component response regulator